jgi:hypothetical protein
VVVELVGVELVLVPDEVFDVVVVEPVVGAVVVGVVVEAVVVVGVVDVVVLLLVTTDVGDEKVYEVGGVLGIGCGRMLLGTVGCQIRMPILPPPKTRTIGLKLTRSSAEIPAFV